MGFNMPAFVLPIWAAHITTTCSTLESLIASIIPTVYGAQSECQSPGADVSSLDTTRSFSAHSEIVILGGGLITLCKRLANEELFLGIGIILI
jgi:hypothetical protein